MTMASSAPDDIVVVLDSIDQLFNAPDLNPFSDKEVDVSGEPALVRVSRRLQSRQLRYREGARLVIRLPADQITPDLQPRVVEAVRRFCRAKIEDNALQIRLGRVTSLTALVIVTVLALVVLAAVYLALNTVLSGAPETLQGLLAASASVFVWVAIWNPLDRLLFEWADPARENRMLRRIMAMEIRLEPHA